MCAGATVVLSATCLVAITALVIYIRTTKTTLREVLQERSVVSLASFLAVNNSNLPSFLHGYPSNPAMMSRLSLKVSGCCCILPDHFPNLLFNRKTWLGQNHGCTAAA